MKFHSLLPALKKASKLSFFIFINKPIGLLRDIMQARYFGLNSLSDAYIAAWKIPNMFRRIFGEGLLNNILLPQLVKIEKEETPEILQEVITVITIITQSIVALLCIVVAYTSTPIITHLCAGSPERIIYGATMLRILIFFTFFITWSAIQAVTLQLKNNFYIGPQSQFFLNIILSIEFFLATIYAFSYTTMSMIIAANGIIMFGIHSAVFYKNHFRYLFPSSKSIFLSLSFFKKFFLGLLTSILLESNSFISLSISSYLKPGLLTLFETLLTLIRLPQQIFGNALATTINIDIIHLIHNKSDSLRETLYSIFSFYGYLSIIFFGGVLISGKLFFHIFFTLSSLDISFIQTSYEVFLIMSGSLFPALVTKILITVLYAHENIVASTTLSFIISCIQNIGLPYFINQYGIYALAWNYFIFDWIRCIIFYIFIEHKYSLFIKKGDL